MNILHCSFELFSFRVNVHLQLNQSVLDTIDDIHNLFSRESE